MAVRKSEAIELGYRFPRHAHLHLLIKLRRGRAAYRNMLARTLGRDREDCPVPCAVTPALEAAKAAFTAKGWAFVENVFTPDFHARFVAEFPRFYYFAPIRNITKSYDTGFGWEAHTRRQPAYMSQNPVVRELYRFIQGSEFASVVTRLCDDGVERSCLAILLTKSYPGSSVIPHQDTASTRPEGQHYVNFVFFISGTGGERAGGLSIMNDAEYRDVVFEPRNLTNSMIFYRTAGPFFHGFKPMRFGTYRWTVNAHFCGRDWLASQPRGR